MKREPKAKDSYQKLLQAPYQLIAVMAFMVILITSVAIYRLYNIGFEGQKKRLIEIVQSQAVMIDIMLKHEIHAHATSLQVVKAEVLSNLIKAHKQFAGFGNTGEYVLGELEQGDIRFLLRHRHNGVDRMSSVSMASNLAEPMRRALKGQSGSVVGLDYRGEKVLAAYAPVNGIGWGIVAKIDISEIQEPYIQEALYGFLGGIVIILFGSMIVIRFIQPLINEIEQGRQYNRMLFNEMPIGLALTDFEGNMVDANPAFVDLTGYPMSELLRLSYWDITPKKYLSQERRQLKALLKNGCYGPYEKEYIHKKGHLLNVRLSGCLITDNNKRYIWSSIEDITKNKQTELELKEAALVFEHTHEAIMITDADVKITRINKQFSEITGYSEEEVEGENPNFLQSGSHDKTFYKQMWHTILTKGTWYGELNNRRKNGEYFATLQSITVVKDDESNIKGYVSVFSDISERKNHETELAYLATHDPLTSLPNRTYFNDNLDKSIDMAKRNKYKLAVLFLDLNRFKEVNDTYGHAIGDALLQEVAKRLKERVREADTVARLGGDEFAIILPNIQGAVDASEVAKKIIVKVNEVFNIKGITIIPSTSIGVSLYPDNAQDPDTLLKYADKAMYSAKQEGHNRYKFFQTVGE